jgi:hypothetical protein
MIDGHNRLPPGRRFVVLSEAEDDDFAAQRVLTLAAESEEGPRPEERASMDGEGAVLSPSFCRRGLLACEPPV